MPPDEIILSDDDEEPPSPPTRQQPSLSVPQSQKTPLPTQSTSSQASISQQQRRPITAGAWASSSIPQGSQRSATQGQGSGNRGPFPSRGPRASKTQAGSKGHDGDAKARVVIEFSTTDEEESGARSLDAADESEEDLPDLDAVINKTKIPPSAPSSARPYSSSAQTSSQRRNRHRSSSDELSMLPAVGRRISESNPARPPPYTPRPSLSTTASSCGPASQPASSASSGFIERADSAATPRASTSQLPVPTSGKPGVQPPPSPAPKKSPHTASWSSSHHDDAPPADEDDSDSSIEFVEPIRRSPPPKRPSPTPHQPSGANQTPHASFGAQTQSQDPQTHGIPTNSLLQPPKPQVNPALAPNPSSPSQFKPSPAASPRPSEAPPVGASPLAIGTGHDLAASESPNEACPSKPVLSAGETRAIVPFDSNFADAFASSSSEPEPQNLAGGAAQLLAGPSQLTQDVATAGEVFAGFASSGDESDEARDGRDARAMASVPQISESRARELLSDSEEERREIAPRSQARPIARKSRRGPRSCSYAGVPAEPVAASAHPEPSLPTPSSELTAVPTAAQALPPHDGTPSSLSSFRARKSTGGTKAQVGRSALASPNPAATTPDAVNLSNIPAKRPAAPNSSTPVHDGPALSPKRRKRRRGSPDKVSPSAHVETSTVSVGQTQQEEELTTEELKDRDEKFKREQQLLPSHLRQFAGPSYNWLREFDTSFHNWVRKREKDWKDDLTHEPLRHNYYKLYSDMIDEAMLKEYGHGHPFRPTVRVVPPRDAPPQAWSCPPVEFIYTNRVVYEDGIVPTQAPGCACEGDCAKSRSCNCLMRQIEASRTRPGGDKRSDAREFAWDKDGLLKPDFLDRGDLVIECNSTCGCGPDCQNRNVGNRNSISVDIFFTGMKGWAVRLPRDWTEEVDHKNHDTGHLEKSVLRRYKAKAVKKGQPLAIYSGELMPTQRAYDREDLIYNHLRRSYVYDLDAWPITEELQARASATYRHKLEDATASLPSRASKSSVAKQDAHDGGNDEALQTPYSIDAFCLGNWTRFANHVCDDDNAVPHPVYVDDDDLTRPLWVYVARRDIQPGEEITISYFGGHGAKEDFLLSGMTENAWKAGADRERENAPQAHRCYCGKPLCRGRMFRPLDDENRKMFYET
ncbi:hypothetical protein JCM11251_008017 [Rhodosporidiobolus azoricus]